MAISLIYSSPFPPPHFPSRRSSTTTTLLITQSSSSFSSIKPSISDYNSLIQSETNAGNPNHALLLFHRMLAIDSLPPDRFTIPAALKACSHLSASSEGQQIHSLLLKSPSLPSSDSFILTSLLHFYSRSRLLHSARKLFDQMHQRDIVSWNTLIRGYVSDRRPYDALKIFLDMQMSRFPLVDDSTMASVVAAITALGLLSVGRVAHAYITRRLLSLNGPLGVAMVDMYAKCGSIESSHTVFLTIKSKRVEHWTAMIAGFATHGFTDSALKLFDEMLNSGTSPNDITFVVVLNACSHGGLVSKGLEYFKLLKSFKIEPGIRHYGCMVDLLGRAGMIDEAMEIVRGMPVEPGFVIWTTLLAACRKHGRAEIGKVAAGKTMGLDSSNGRSYVLLSNLYADLGRREESRIVRKAMEDDGAGRKIAGSSWIEIDGRIHEFVSGDGFHFRAREIYEVLENVRSYLRLVVEEHDSISAYWYEEGGNL